MNIRDIRQQFPQYDDLSDKQLADALHGRFYSDIPLDEFYAKIGLESKRATVGGAFQSGLASLLSSLQTGAGVIGGDANKAAEEGVKRSQERAEKYGEAASLDRVKRAYQEQGLLPAAGEVLRQVPGAIAEQLPNLAQMAGGARLGAMAGAPFGPYGSIVGAGVGVLAPGMLQYIGSGAERQAQEQLKEGRPVDVDVGKAVAAAVPSAAIDVAGPAVALGRRVVGKVLGGQVEKMLLKGAEESAEKLAQEKLKSVLLKGTIAGGIEIPGELAQQMLERAQAGLSLTSEDALQEYADTAYGAGLLAPLGIVGRVSERSGARDIVEGRRREQEVKDRAAQQQLAQEEEAKRQAYMQTDAYVDEVQQRYTDLQNRVAELRKISKTKVDANDLAGKRAQQIAGKELSDLLKSDEYQSTVNEFLAVRDRAKERQTAAEYAKAMETPGAQANLFGAPTVEDQTPLTQLQTLAKQRDALDKQIAELGTPQEQQPLLTQKNALDAQIQQLAPSAQEYDQAQKRLADMQRQAQIAFSESTDTASSQQAVAQYQQASQALAELEKFAPFVPPATTTKMPNLGGLQQQLQKARDLGDVETAAKLLPQIAELEQQPDLFGAGNKRFDFEQQMANEMAQAREQAAAARARVQQEQEALARIQAAQRPDESSAATVLQQQKLHQARMDYAGYERYFSLTRQLENLKQQADQSGVTTPDAVQKLQDQLDELRRSSQGMDQFERDKKEAELVAELKTKRDTLKRYAKNDVVGPTRNEAAILKSMRTLEEQLADVRRQIGLADRFRNQTPVADNVLTQASDERTGALIDQLLGAVQPAQKLPMPPIAAEAKQQAEKSQAQIADATKPLRTQLEQLQQNPRLNKAEIERVTQEIADIENTGLQGNLFAPLIAPASEAVTAQPVTTAAPRIDNTLRQAEEARADAFDALYAELEKQDQLNPASAVALSGQLKRTIAEEIDARLQAAKAASLTTDERKQLDGEVARVLSDMYRLSVPRSSETGGGFGSPAAAIPVIQEQLDNIVRRFGTDLYAEERGAQESKPRRVESSTIETSEDMLQKLRSNQQALNTLNEYIKKAGTPKQGPKFDELKAVTAQRDALAAEQTRLRRIYNARAERLQATTPEQARPESVRDAVVGMGATPQQLAALDTRLQTLRAQRQAVIDQRSKQGQVGRTPQEQQLLDKYAKEGPALITQYDNEIDRLEALRKKAAPAEAQMRERYNAARQTEAAGPVLDERERVEMQQQLDTVNRQLENLTVQSASGNIRQQLERARDELEAKLAYQGPEAKERSAQMALPGVARGAAALAKAVPPEQLTEVQTQMVDARTRVEALKEALRRTGTEPQYFREVAQRLRAEVDTFEDAYEARKGSNISQEKWDRLRAASDKKLSEVLYFEALASSTEDRDTARAEIQKALDKAVGQMTQLEDTYRSLSERQRRYEAQEDVRREALPGQRAAERIQQGRGEGYLTPTGKKVYKPKQAESWDVKKDSTAKVPKAAEVMSAANVQRAARQLIAKLESAISARLSAAKKEANASGPELEKLEQLATQLKNGLSALNGAYNKLFPEGTEQQYAAELEQITKLLDPTAQQLEQAKTFETRYNQLLTTVGSDFSKEFSTLLSQLDAAVKDAANDIGFAKQEVAAAGRAVDAAYARAANADISQRGVAAGMKTVTDLADKKLEDANTALLEADNRYKQLRAAQLRMVQRYAEDLTRTKAAFTDALAQITDAQQKAITALQTANKEVEPLQQRIDALEKRAEQATEKAKKERDAAQFAKDKERQERNKALDEAAKIRDRLQRAKEGLGLPGQRVVRDTAGTLPTAVQNEIKARLARAETELAQIMRNPNATTDEIKLATAKVEGISHELDTVFATVKDIATRVEQIEETGTNRAQQEMQDRLARAEAYLEQLEQDSRSTLGQVKAAKDRVDAIKAEMSGPKPVEGMRLPERRQGPVVANLTGSRRVRQAGIARLRASGMSQETANNIALAHYKAKLDAEPNSKDAQEAFSEATKDMTPAQIDAAVAEGNRLLGTAPTLELIGARETARLANEEYAAAERDLSEARKSKDPAMITLAEDALNMASTKQDEAVSRYNAAVALYENQFTKSSRTGSRATKNMRADLENDLDATFYSKLPELEKDEASITERQTAKKGQVVFRTAKVDGPGMHVDRVAALVRRITDSWKNVPTITLANTFDDLPAHIREAAEKTGNTDSTPGVFDTVNNVVYLVADRLHTGEDVIATVAHEIAGHYGLRSILGNDYPRIMRMIFEGNKQVRALAQAKLDATPDLGVEVATEEVLADMAERGPTPETKGVLARLFAFVKNLLNRLSGQKVSDDYVRQIVADARKYVVEGGQAGPGGMFRANAVFRSRSAPASAIIGQQAKGWDELRGNLFGLGGRVQYFDRFGAADEGMVRAQSAGMLSSAQAENAQYFMRLSEMTTQAAGQFITSGPVKIVSEKIGNSVEERYQSQTGANLVRLAEHVDAAAKAGLGDRAENIVTVIMAGNRASGLTNGWERLNSGNPAAARAEYEAYKRELASNAQAKRAVDAAIAEYQEYNNGLLDFLVQTDFMSPEDAARLKKVPYVPFYRVDNGQVMLYTGDERPIRIGNLTSNPDLKQLLGDDRHIMPILTSAVQNTFMLARTGLRNKGTYVTSDALFKAGFASKFGKGPGPDGPSTVRFKVKGVDYFATIDTDTFGVPADLVVRGMEGIKTTIPLLVKMMGVPANWVRKFVTRSPAYVIRQLIRDPINAAIVGGVDGTPVLNALREMSKMRGGRSVAENALMRGLVVSSNVFTGDERDMQKFLEDISTGRGKWDKMLGMLDAVALQADAATRAVVYQDSIKKGMTTRQAEFRALEVQNFSRRGLSPSAQMLNVMVPFFNAQLQGLDVLYRSLPLPWKKASMPFADRLEIQRKIIARGLMLMTGTLGYALMMQDDEAYMKASPEERYGNFFINIPGVKDPLKIPIPYEVGILFKALPEAVVNVAMSDTKAKEAAKGVGMLLWQSTPSVVPVGGRVFLEAGYNQTAFGPIESQRERGLLPEDRYRENTPEVLKALGGLTSVAGVSPLMLEHFVRGFTGALGVSLLHVFDPVLAEQGMEKASTGASKLPFVGGLFQSADGRFLIDRAYSRMEEIKQAANSYERAAKAGRKAEAEELRQRYGDVLASEKLAGTFEQRMGKMFTDERSIRENSRLSAAQKDALIARIKAMQNKEAQEFYAVTERTRPR